MYDLTITGGLVVDGTGAPARRADVGIVGGRIASIGTLDGKATSTIDATDQIVAPGFIDVHTHYDAQAFWDTTLSPSPLHGVTTVFAGNCGFTIAPLGISAGQAKDAADGDYLMRMLARVEGMPLESLQQGVPWDWTTTAEYLDRLDGTLMPNAGFLVGHSALRRVVMHDEATQREATEAEIEAMVALLRDGLAAGGIGFSSTWSPSHNDHTGGPVPSRFASREELLRLCAVTGEYPGTTLEFLPGIGPFTAETKELMAEMSRVANRPLNWNVLPVQGQPMEAIEHQLHAGDVARDHGGRVVALTLPDTLRTRLNLRSGFVLDMLQGWDKLMALPADEKIRQLTDADQRAEWDAAAKRTPGTIASIGNWADYRVLETFSPQNKAYEGRTVGEIAAERGADPWDTLAEIAVADDLHTVITRPDTFQDRATWERRVGVWRDPRAIVGASDAGAHLDMIDSYGFSSTLLGKAVREHELLGVEEAVQMITQRQAELYGVRDRGTLAEGNHADVVVFDPARIGSGAVETRFDLPGGAPRVYGEAEGIEHVLVNGVPVVRGSELLEARPGTLLRSGRDTATVTAR